MKITKQQLIEKAATRDLIEWFGQEFGEEAELEELKKKLGRPNADVTPPYHWLHWLFEVFELTGTLEFRHPGGKLWVLCFYKDGKLDGLYECWYANGQLEEKYTYKDGRLDGLYEVWDEDGNQVESLTYKDGEVVK